MYSRAAPLRGLHALLFTCSLCVHWSTLTARSLPCIVRTASLRCTAIVAPRVSWASLYPSGLSWCLVQTMDLTRRKSDEERRGSNGGHCARVCSRSRARVWPLLRVVSAASPTDTAWSSGVTDDLSARFAERNPGANVERDAGGGPTVRLQSTQRWRSRRQVRRTRT